MPIRFGSGVGSGSVLPTVDLGRYSLASNLSDKVITIHKFGYNPQISSGATEDVWDVGSDYTYPNVATVADIVSTSTQDSSTGTGVGSITIQGLDENWNLITEEVVLNGINPVSTTNTFIRVFRLRVSDGGLGASDNSAAVGNISATVDGSVIAQIVSGNTTTNMAMVSVPAGYTAFFNSVVSSGGPNDDYILYVQGRLFGKSTFVTTSNFEVSNSEVLNFDFDPSGANTPEKSDIKFRAEAVSNNVQVRVLFTVIFVENTYLQTLSNSL